jgi:hypothetical protein
MFDILSFIPIIVCLLAFPILLWNADRALTPQTRSTLQAALSGAGGPNRVRWTEAFLAYYNTWFGPELPTSRKLLHSCALSTAFFFIAAILIALGGMFDIGLQGYVYMAFFWLVFGIAATWPRDYVLFAQVRYATRLMDMLSTLPIEAASRPVRWGMKLLIKCIVPILIVALAAALIIAFSWALRLLIDYAYGATGLQERVVVAADQLAAALPQQSGNGREHGLQYAKMATYVLPIFAACFIAVFAWIWVFATALARLVRRVIPLKPQADGAATPRPLRLLSLLALPVVVLTSPLIATIFVVVGYAALAVLAALGIEFY